MLGKYHIRSCNVPTNPQSLHMYFDYYCFFSKTISCPEDYNELMTILGLSKDLLEISKSKTELEKIKHCS